MKKRIAVLGTPCGGTNHIAMCLQERGIDARHEHLGADGIVCGFYAWRPRNRRYPLFHEIEWDHVVQLVRNPFDVAETLPGYLETLPAETPCADPILASLRYWVRTHEKIKKIGSIALRLRIGEWLDGDWTELMETLGVQKTSKPECLITRKQRRWPRKDWDWWLRADPEYAARAANIWAEAMSA